MSENYSVGVRLSLIENVSKGLTAMAARFSSVDKQAQILQGRLDSLKSQVMVGAGMIGFGAALATPLVYATKQAANLEQQLKMVQVATRANAEQMEEFHKTITNTAMSSIFNETDVAKMAKTVALSGNFSIAQVQGMMPQFVNFAAAQKFLKGTNPDQAVSQGIKLAEITGNFDPKSIETSLNALTKLSLLMPGSVDKVLAAFKYMQGNMKNIMGMSDEHSLMLIAFLQRMGMEGTRAGSQLMNFVSRTIPEVFGSGLWKGKSLENLRSMNMLDATGTPKIFTDGKVDPLKLFNNLGKFITDEFAKMPEAMARADIERKFVQTFGQTGTRLASILTSPDAIKQYEELGEMFKRHPDLDVLIGQFNQLFNYQLQRTAAGFNTVITELGFAILPHATKALEFLNNQLQNLANWINKNQGLVRVITETALVVAGLSILGGTFILLRAGILGLLIPLQILTAIMPAVAAGFLALNLPMVLIVAAVAAVGFALYELYTHWDTVQAKIAELYAAFQNTAPYKIIIGAIEALNSALEFLANKIFNILGISTNSTNGVSPTSGLASKAISSMATSVLPPEYRLLKLAYDTVMPNTVSGKDASAPTMQNDKKPIHVQINMDGRKIAQAVASYISNFASSMPGSSSQFDTNLSPMPSVANSIGITR